VKYSCAIILSNSSPPEQSLEQTSTELEHPAFNKTRPSVYLLGDKVDIEVVLKVLVQLDDVGVIQGLQDLHFSLEAVPVLDLLSWNLFRSTHLFGLFVDGLVDFTVGTFSESLQNENQLSKPNSWVVYRLTFFSMS